MNFVQLRSYHIQEHRHVSLPIFNVDRVDYTALLDSLRYPLVWSFDEMLQSWIPAEVDHEFLNYVVALPFTFDADTLPKGRWAQINRAAMVEPPRNSVEQLKDLMNTYGHVKIANLMPAEYTKSMLKQYYWRNNHLHDRWNDLEGIKRTSSNNLPLMRLLHQATQGLVNQLTPEAIKTSYSFTSAYERGSNLPAHTDRPQCVWNISFMLAGDPPDISLMNWPFFIQYNGQAHQINLEAGDGVLYSGVRDLHWREVMPPELCYTLGVFFHYVPAAFEGSLD